MKYALSYFYQIRNFKPNMIPVSTAMWDPKWYHDWMGPEYTFVDKRGIVNGLRCEELHGDESCEGLCGPDCTDHRPECCEFLKNYRKHLDSLDWSAIEKRAQIAAADIQSKLQFTDEPIIVFIVYETPKNPCSERVALLAYFKDNGIDCQELSYPIS